MKWVFMDYVMVCVFDQNNIDLIHDFRIVIMFIMIIDFIINIIDFAIIIANKVDQVIIDKAEEFIITKQTEVIKFNINKLFIIEDIVIFIDIHYY